MIVPSAHYFLNWKFLTIPWQILSVVGTAVAFYVGFKKATIGSNTLGACKFKLDFWKL